ncbi:MAG: hypothetical protein J7L90_04595 [Dehalococcoidia bacterium]|nr:hypothetical protein [Dehalococcoidia bacterium]
MKRARQNRDIHLDSIIRESDRQEVEKWMRRFDSAGQSPRAYFSRKKTLWEFVDWVKKDPVIRLDIGKQVMKRLGGNFQMEALALLKEKKLK